MRSINEAVIFIGIQATGKSEFYRRKFADTHMRINLDMLKTRNRERILFEACIEARQSFVIDNTNPTKADRERYIIKAKEAGFRVTGYYFKSSISESITRNELRQSCAKVPAGAIAGTHSKLELPSLSEGYDELYYVHIGEDGSFIVEDFADEV